MLAAERDLSAAKQAAQALQLDHELALILAHSRIILERKPITDQLVQQILLVPLPRMALLLEEAYSMHYRSATDRALLLRQILFGLALATVVLGLTDVILRVRRSAQALEGRHRRAAPSQRGAGARTREGAATRRAEDTLRVDDLPRVSNPVERDHFLLGAVGKLQ